MSKAGKWEYWGDLTIVKKKSVIGRTPEDLGLKSGVQLVEAWEPQTYYIVDVAFNSSNPIHRYVMYSGFLNEMGNPNGYNEFMGIDANFSECYFLKQVAKIDIKELAFKCFEYI